MEPFCRIEPIGDEFLDIEPEASWLIEKIGWRNCFGKFDGHNSEVTRRFTLSLKDNVAQIRDLTLIISKGFVSKATKLPQTGERCFKIGEIDKAKWKQFLLPLPANFDDKFGFPTKFLKT